MGLNIPRASAHEGSIPSPGPPVEQKYFLCLRLFRSLVCQMVLEPNAPHLPLTAILCPICVRMAVGSSPTRGSSWDWNDSTLVLPRRVPDTLGAPLAAAVNRVALPQPYGNATPARRCRLILCSQRPPASVDADHGLLFEPTFDMVPASLPVFPVREPRAGAARAPCCGFIPTARRWNAVCGRCARPTAAEG